MPAVPLSPARKVLCAAVVGLLALAGPVGQAAAQPSAAKPAGDEQAPKPPPLNMDQLPKNDPPAKDEPYVKEKECIQPNTSGTVTERPWGQLALNFEQVYRFARGKGQKVAVIDTGVNPHPRFGDRVEGGGDYVEDGKDGAFDCYGHGTLVAGIIATDDSDKTVGFKGVAPDARIVGIRQADPNFSVSKDNKKTTAGNVSTLAKAIRHAADIPGVTVINISETVCMAAAAAAAGGARHVEMQAAIHYAAKEKGIVVVVAAGNTESGDKSNCKKNNEPGKFTLATSPAWYDDDVLSVAAMQRDGKRAEFSIGGPWVDIAGPGTENTSVDPAPGAVNLANRTIEGANGQPSLIQGTSFAAPYVAGVAALVRERFPKLNAYQVMDRIKKTAKHPAGKNGRDFYLGYGMVDPVAAVTAVLPDEQGVAPAAPVRTEMALTKPLEKDWQPAVIALIGAGGGLGLLLLTLFVVRAVQRTRRQAGPPAPRLF